MDTATLERILIEVATGKKAARKDTAEEATMRSKLTQECNEIKKKGGVIDVPSEIPDLD